LIQLAFSNLWGYFNCEGGNGIFIVDVVGVVKLFLILLLDSVLEEAV